MKFGISVIVGILFSITLCAQGNYVLELDFSDCIVEDLAMFSLPVNQEGNPDCSCSPDGDSYVFNGSSDALTVTDTNLRFRQAFSVSVVFRPDRDLDNQRLISYKTDCNSTRGFDITYQGSQDMLVFELYEDLSRRIFFDIPLDPNRCWHALTAVKTGSTYIIYLYGEQIFRTMSTGSFLVGNSGTLTIGSGPCVPGFANAFGGAINYISVYDDVLPIADIQSFVIETNRILTPDALVFLGESITPEVDTGCATVFNWSPTTGVSDANLSQPVLGPEESTTYTLEMQDGGCTVEDSIRVLVVDPSEVTCNELILPSAFTPNGDGLNDTYFISNGFVVEELIQFEIFDRWGGKLFSTNDISLGWDGRHQGEFVMPGVYVYKAEYMCNGETKNQVGSFSVLN